MTTTRIHVMESRPLDARYDQSFIGPFTNVANDPRVTAAISSTDMVAGQARFKYFRRPVMPRINAIPAHILLAPTKKNEEAAKSGVVLDEPEPMVKDAEVQTLYRESEAQTLPYTPQYVIAPDQNPEVLLIKDLTYASGGLPLGKKEIEMVEYARKKKELNMNLPPFTDEASMLFRKHLMEQQELREFNMREAEMDSKREARLVQLQQALMDRNESNEFLASQRVEALRQSRMEEREKVLQKIRAKRIKVLRQLAHRRNHSDPILSEGRSRDIINDYFDKGSEVYAPVKRLGADSAKTNPEKFDVTLRTAPLDNINNISGLENAISDKVMHPNNAQLSMSKTAPASMFGKKGGGVADARLTSAAQRHLRHTKRDLEEMHQILLRKKRTQAMLSAQSGNSRLGSRASALASEKKAKAAAAAASALLAKKPKGRPNTPDLTRDDEGQPLPDNQELYAAVLLLQRLLRGRAVQNLMYEGRYRRRELIKEIRLIDEMEKSAVPPDGTEVMMQAKAMRDLKIKETSLAAVGGGIVSNTVMQMAQEQERIDAFEDLQKQAISFMEERRLLEAKEAGRRYRENMAYPAPSSSSSSSGDTIPDSESQGNQGSEVDSSS